MASLFRLAFCSGPCGRVLDARRGHDKNGVRGSFEHIAAYLISALLLMSALPGSSPWMIGGALAVYAGILEIGQIYVPGRHSQLEDFVASCLGVAIIIVPTLWIRRRASPMHKGT
jgi:VanZ family protein